MTAMVLQEYIEACHRGNPVKCPVAMALFAAGITGFILVGKYHFSKDGESFRLPKEVTAFIMAFDAGHSVVPFAFELDFKPYLHAP